MLWNWLQDRNQEATPGAHPMTEDEFSRAWGLFQLPSPEELASVDSYHFHTGGLD